MGKSFNFKVTFKRMLALGKVKILKYFSFLPWKTNHRIIMYNCIIYIVSCHSIEICCKCILPKAFIADLLIKLDWLLIPIILFLQLKVFKGKLDELFQT